MTTSHKKIQEACRAGDLAQVKRLIESSHVPTDNLLNVAVRSACIGDQGHVFEYLVNQGAVSEEYCKTNFHYLCEKRKANIVAVICKRFVLNTRMLSHALYEAVVNDNIAIVRVLLAARADFIFCVLPRIHLDCEKGREIFKLLVRKTNTCSWFFNARACSRRPLSLKLIEYMYKVKRGNLITWLGIPIALTDIELEYLANKHTLYVRNLRSNPRLAICNRFVNIASALVCKDIAYFLHRFVYKPVSAESRSFY